MQGVDKKLLFPIIILYLVTQTIFIQVKSEDRKDSSPKMVEVVYRNEQIFNTTTSQVIEEETTTTTQVVEETTTTVTPRPVRTTTTVYFREELSGGGPPRNITSLVGCIAYYESTWGDGDPNIFQFIQSTWAAYGGTGSPGNAPYWRQEEIFWLAWNDAGPHHWAAQKGRCF